MNDFIGNYNQWVLAGGVLLTLLVAVELGYRFGRHRRVSVNEDVKSQVAAIMGALFTLVALLLGFSFAMVMSRVDVRRQLVIHEANAIGTAHLRAQLIPEPEKKEVSSLLEHYVNIRVEAVRQGKLTDATAQSEQIIQRLWSTAVGVAEKMPHDSVSSGLFLTSLNELIDTHAKRLMAETERISAVILELLVLASIITSSVLGYFGGLVGRRNFTPNLLLMFLITAVIFVIIDLDRPQEGLIRVNQRAMELLQRSFEHGAT